MVYAVIDTNVLGSASFVSPLLRGSIWSSPCGLRTAFASLQLSLTLYGL